MKLNNKGAFTSTKLYNSCNLSRGRVAREGGEQEGDRTMVGDFAVSI